MLKLWGIFTMTLIASVVIVDNCELADYSKECFCFNTGSELIMECTPVNSSSTDSFKIKYLPPYAFVSITCVNNPNWSTFHYKINSITQEVQRLSFQNCSLDDNLNMNEIVSLVGGEKVKILSFSNNLMHKNLTLSKEYLQGFSDVVELNIEENYLLGDLDEDLLQNLSQLTTLNLRHNKIKSIPKNFFQFVSNLQILEIGNNKIKTFEPETFKNLKDLTFLNMWSNELVELNYSIFTDLISLKTLDLHHNNLSILPQGIFDTLKHLETVNLSDDPFETLPGDLFQKNTNLRTVKLRMARKLKTLPSGLFSNLKNLTSVQLDGGKLEYLPEDLFQGSTEIKEIYLNGNNLQTLPENIFDDLKKLVLLRLDNNQIQNLPDKLFSSCKNLQNLYLNKNRIVSISKSLFRGLSSLKGLFMEFNNISNIEKQAFQSLIKVTDINLSFNNITDLEVGSDVYVILSIFQSCLELQKLNLAHNRIPQLFSDWITIPPSKFTYLDLSYNKIHLLLDEHLDFKHREDFTINLSNNEIETIELSDQFEEHYLRESRSNILVKLENNPIECSCFLYEFVRYLDKSMNHAIFDKLTIKVGSAKCSNPKELQDTPLINLKSENYKCKPPEFEQYDNKTLCPESCAQWKRPYDHTLIFDCSNRNLTQVPKSICNIASNKFYNEVNLTGNFISSVPKLNQNGYQRVKTLLLSQNHIKTISKDVISPTLKTLELHDNDITTLSMDTLNQMKTSLESVTLGGNPWKCNCEAREFQHFIQMSSFPIKDLEQVTCENSNKSVKALTVNELCPSSSGMTVAISLTIAFLGLTIGILAALYYRYQIEIKVWLYAHQMCLWLVSEEELDKDKPYDAFISYSHKDEDFVVRELVTKLESGHRPFKLCIHFRDWLAGGWIPNQITNSVKDSKRTIVVVSPNFVQSEWGRLEFRAAHCQALSEGRARVIVILYGDIGPVDQLEPELKAYLSMNTYVKWGDPWFWDKLRYALPHKSELARKSYESKIFKRQQAIAQLNFNQNQLKELPENGMTPLTENVKNLQNGNALVETIDDELKKLNSIC